MDVGDPTADQGAFAEVSVSNEAYCYNPENWKRRMPISL
jgi:hypothetical protein